MRLQSALDTGKEILCGKYQTNRIFSTRKNYRGAIFYEPLPPPEWLGIFDVVSINRYYGWYGLGGRLDQAAQVLERELDALHKSFGKPIVITEFGADTVAGQYSQPDEMWTEEYQVEFLRRWEGHAYTDEFSGFEMVRQHQSLCRRLWDAASHM
jgi:beta-galactosidase/beta-glucuronidase